MVRYCVQADMVVADKLWTDCRRSGLTTRAHGTLIWRMG